MSRNHNKDIYLIQKCLINWFNVQITSLINDILIKTISIKYLSLQVFLSILGFKMKVHFTIMIKRQCSMMIEVNLLFVDLTFNMSFEPVQSWYFLFPICLTSQQIVKFTFSGMVHEPIFPLLTKKCRSWGQLEFETNTAW